MTVLQTAFPCFGDYLKHKFLLPQMLEGDDGQVTNESIRFWRHEAVTEAADYGISPEEAGRLFDKHTDWMRPEKQARIKKYMAEEAKKTDLFGRPIAKPSPAKTKAAKAPYEKHPPRAKREYSLVEQCQLFSIASFAVAHKCSGSAAPTLLNRLFALATAKNKYRVKITNESLGKLTGLSPNSVTAGLRQLAACGALMVLTPAHKGRLAEYELYGPRMVENARTVKLSPEVYGMKNIGWLTGQTA
jgi:hypothetical protein